MYFIIFDQISPEIGAKLMELKSSERFVTVPSIWEIEALVWISTEPVGAKPWILSGLSI